MYIIVLSILLELEIFVVNPQNKIKWNSISSNIPGIVLRESFAINLGILETVKKFMKCVIFFYLTEPNPPTNLQCPQSPLDISLEISWTAPAEPNGLIYRYQINVSLGNLSQIFTTSNETSKNVENLSPGMT